MIPYLDLNYLKEKPKLWLCKPDRTVISKLTDIYNFDLKTKENTLSEITFDIPVQIERNHELIDNPLISNFKGLYYIKMVKDGKTEYFVSSKHGGSLSDDGVSKSYTLYSLGHQLDNKIIRGYEGVSQNLTKFATDFLKETNWSIGSVDVDFDLKYRGHSISSSTVLQCLYDIAELFGAYIEWDTVNRRVSFYDPNKVGLNRGLRFKEGFYLESFDVEFDYDEIITRLKVYGQDGLEFRRLSPTGSNYLEDFTWFMYPFSYTYDAVADTYTVNSSSDYMSDGLCVSIVKYTKKLEANDTEFKNLVNQKTTTEDSIIQKEQELSVLETELKTLHNELDIINATYGDQASGRTDYGICVSNINTKKSQINSKKSEITSLENSLATINNNISLLRTGLLMENNFTSEQLLELNDFIIEKEYTNDSIVDEQDLLDEGLEVFKTMSIPKVSLSINVANFIDSLENDPNRKKLILGDKIRFKSERLKIELSARISEINYNYENGNITVGITNVHNTKNEDEKLFDMIYGSASTSTTVNMDKFKWNDAVTKSNDVSKILDNTFDATLKGIKGGVNDSITLNERGLFSTSAQDGNAMLVIQGGMLAISPDNLQSVSVAINKDGVFADKLVGRMILSNKLHVEDDLGVVKIESGTQTIFDANGVKKIELGKYTDPSNASLTKYGLRIYDGAIDIRTSSSNNLGVQFDSNGIRAFNSLGVKTFDINSSTGLVSVVGSVSIKTSSSTSRGVEIDGNGLRGFNTTGGKTFEIDINGNAYFAGYLDYSTGYLNEVGGTFAGTVTGTLSANTVNAININASQITAGTIDAGMISATSLSAISANLGTITSGTINAVTINSATVNSATININEDIRVGKNIYLGSMTDYTTTKLVRFNGMANIEGGIGFASAGIKFNCDELDVSSCSEIIWGANKPTAVWA